MPLVVVFLAWPFLEIAGFIVVGRAIGVLPTLGLLFAAMVAGVAILRELGFATVTRLRAEMSRGGAVPGEAIGHSALTAVAALLLIVPGFLSDVVGLALLLPPVRRLVMSAIARHAQVVVVETRQGGAGRGGARPTVVDLEEGEWSRHEPNGAGEAPGSSPWRKLDGPDAPH